MGKKKTHEEYVEELAIKNPDLEVLERYINATTPISHRCKIDMYEWKAVPNNLLRGHGCPKCANVLKKTTNEYMKELSKINPNIMVLGKYSGAHIPIKHYCKVHDITWMISPTNALSGNGCYECSKEKIGLKLRKKHDEYVKDLSIVNPNIEIIDEYINAHVHILHRCKIDGCEWYAQPYNILNGTGCPQCNESHGERQIRQWLQNNKFNYIPQKTFDDCKNKQYLPFDFYLPDYNVCIEYDGEQHFRPVDHFGGECGFKKRKDNDAIKTKYCNDNNINLLRIPYFKNVEEELKKFLFI